MKESSPGIRNLVFDKGHGGVHKRVGGEGGGVGRVGGGGVGLNCHSRNPIMLSGKVVVRVPTC